VSPQRRSRDQHRNRK